jgi:HlyD family secretion protein
MVAVYSHGAVVREIQTLYESGTAGGLSDRQLLDQFMSRRDASAETAFEVLLLRHGPMVLRACRDILREPSDIDDAFQATFLVLVKRSRSMGRIESVGGWLYGVACKVAARARIESARRREREERAALRVVEAVDSSGDGGTAAAELGPVVQDAVRRLPAKYRDVVVLCYWEGLTQEQAATQLGCPLGTVRSRIARARKLLERRLSRQGLAPGLGKPAAGAHAALASVLGAAPGLSPVPPQLVQATVRAASQIAAGSTTAQVLSSLAATLVRDTLGSMTMIKIKMALLGVALVGFTGSSVWVSGLRGQAAPTTRRANPKDAAQVEKNQPAGTAKGYSLVQGKTTILMIVPDGSTVEKGQVVCELDSAALRDQLVNQQITVLAAKANYENHKLARETAEIDVVEFTHGIFPVQAMEAGGEIKIAEAELALAEDTLDALKNGSPPGSKLEVQRAKVALLRARYGLEKAQGRRKLLFDYTKSKKLKELQTAVGQAHSAELAKQATMELEQAKVGKIERAISACRILAPADGKLVYAKAKMIDGGGPPGQIGVGEVVSQRQFLFEIIPAPAAAADRR